MKLPRIKIEARVAILYLLFGGLWILLSDNILAALVNDPATLTRIQTYKGWGFVVISASLIYVLIRSSLVLQRQAEEELQKTNTRLLRLNRLYVTLGQIDQTIVHARDREALFGEICKVTIEHGGYRMAWIGLMDETDGLVKPAVFAGEELGYLANIKISYLDEELGRGPTGTAVRERRCVICQDIATEPHMAPWREQALQHGYLSSASVPICQQGRVIGAMTVYAAESHGFDPEDEKLLEEIGDDISFALDTYEVESERKRATQELADAYEKTIEGWSRALDLRDKETEGHTQRVTEMSLKLAQALGVSAADLVNMRRGGLLHDIGKMGVSDSILLKPGPLTDEEWLQMRKHPEYAYEMMVPIAYLNTALEIPYCHHERWDGSGYPRGLKGDQIPISARIFAVVDVYDALTSDRPYRAAWERKETLDYIREMSGKQFDPRIVKMFLELFS